MDDSRYCRQLVLTLKQFQKDDYLCDTTLLANDGKLKAHSIVLAAGSTLFKTLLPSYSEPRQHVIHLPDLEMNELEVAVQFLYSGELVVPFTFSSPEDLSALITKLSLLGLEIPYLAQDSDNSDVDANDGLSCPRAEHSINEISFKKVDETVSPSSNNFGIGEADKQLREPVASCQQNALETVNQSTENSETAADGSSTGRVACSVGEQLRRNRPTNASTRRRNRSIVAASNGGGVQVSHICDICGKYFRSSYHLNVHRPLHSGARPFACADCGLSFSLQNNLKRHRLKHTGDRQFLCHRCGESFIQRSSLVDHTSKHHPELVGTDPTIRPFRCRVCNETFCNTSRLRSHVNARHRIGVGRGAARTSMTDCRRSGGGAPSAEFLCQVCSRRLSCKMALIYHMRRHTGERPVCRFRCHECGRAFEWASQLKNHVIERHTGSGPHRCGTCDRAFGTASALKLHMRKHGAAPTHPCEVCGKRFVTRQSLQLHSLLHSDEKPHQCPDCGRRYRQLAHLRQHQLTHTREKPHGCELCAKAYRNRVDLRLHCERVHQLSLPIVKRSRSNGAGGERHVSVESCVEDDDESKNEISN